MQKDLKETEEHKKMMINEIKSIDKTKLFVNKPKKKVSFIDKVITILGYGKKG
jgi:hypothetical protein